MRQLAALLYLLLGISVVARGQQSKNVKLLCNWRDTTNSPINSGGQNWNDVWGFTVKGVEYAVIGGTKGAHIIDVNACKEVQFLNTNTTGISHRDYKTYQNYLYCVADEGLLSTLLVYDISKLPDTATLVWSHNRDTLTRAHTIFIDTARAKLYCASAKGFTGDHHLSVFSLKDPAKPKFLAAVDAFFDKTHALYARNDTAWLSNGWGGFVMMDMSSLPSYKILGGISAYPYKGYNHSSWVGYDNIGVMTDESFGSPVKVIDTRLPYDIQVLSTFSPRGLDSTSVAHNPYLLGHYVVLSYYQDGLQIYDISDPKNPRQTGYYDTYPEPDGQRYAGAWGCYPFLPSRRILVSDMQTGLYVFDADEAMNIRKDASFAILSNPDKNQVYLQLPYGLKGQLAGKIYDMSGRYVARVGAELRGDTNPPLPVSLGTDLASGIYVLHATLGGQTFVGRFVKW
jgi:choice-of-anchor B domain-containing protein